MRVIGFAAAPGVFLLFAFVPVLGWLVQIGVAVWLLMTMVIGVRQALDFRSTGRAVTVVLVGWVIYIVLLAVFKRRRVQSRRGVPPHVPRRPSAHVTLRRMMIA